ncbi:MAG: MFS transporter [Lactimicrobium sp.]|jgi:oligogalacturonide transporter|uniref:MFS transporter n=1 Tax=Lactimicrobium sp. TaxID=2563780 RepID=UPI002F35C3DF
MKEKKKNVSEDSFRSKAAYGFADIYGGGAFVVISTFFTVFLTKALGMPTALAGTIPLIGKVWDAVTDPIMGNIADRTKSRFGPKRFYILIGSFISAITFALMWVPFHASNTAMYLFYVLMYMLFSTGFTIVMVPYNGLLPDMIDDYHRRAAYSSVRMAFSAFGSILAGLIPTLMIKDNTNASQYFKVGLVFAILFLIVILLTFAGTWEKQKQPVKVSMKDSFRQAFSVYRSRSFRLLIGIFLCGQGAADFFTGLAVYYVDDVLNAYGGGRFTILMGVLLVSQFLGMILFSTMSTKKNKEWPLLVSYPIRIIATLALLFFSHEGSSFLMILILSFFIGISMAGTTTTIYAILSDLADVDELITGVSRPATVSAMATFARKVATGLASAIIGILLAMVGYDEVLASSGARQSAFTQHGIAAIFIIVPCILMTAAYIFTRRFPMKEAEFQIVRKELDRRKGLDTSIISEHEKQVCQEVTGIPYENLYHRDNV